jgi:imidazolonepropionase-like amidohydrolase
LLLLFAVFLLGAQPVVAAEPHVLVFAHATVIDATGAPAQRDVTVIITDDRITALGKSADLPLPTNAVIVDATGKFLIPGLWDMHVHWYETDYLPLFIANGVTGVRMMWGMPLHHEWRKEIEQGTLVGPRLFLASTLVDGPKPFWPGSMTASNDAEGRQAVTRAREDGADFVKVYTGLPREAYFAIAEEAKKQGIPFAGHVPLSVSAEEASQAGQRSIEHLTGILPACSSRAAELLKSAQAALAGVLATNEPMGLRTHLLQERRVSLETYSRTKAAAVFAEFKTNHTWQCPTLTVLRDLRYIDDPAITNDARLKYVSRGLRASWDPGGDERLQGMTADDVAVGRRTFQKELEIVGTMRRAGVDILAGTDTGNPYCFPGFSLHDELGLLVQAGLTPMEALQAATLNPARFMGRDRELGTLEPGKLADLVLLDANPLDDIANTRKINAVVCRGRLFPKSSLDEMLAATEALASRSKIPIADALWRTIRAKDVDAAVKQYHELKSTRDDAYDFSEEQLNGLGYQLMATKRMKDAIRILQLNAVAWPQSANVYDSLGEAYLNDGNRELAIENYERSLQLDPKNKGAMEKLKQLKTR